MHKELIEMTKPIMICMALGAGIGVIFGGKWIALGAGIGLALGSAFPSKDDTQSGD